MKSASFVYSGVYPPISPNGLGNLVVLEPVGVAFPADGIYDAVIRTADVPLSVEVRAEGNRFKRGRRIQKLLYALDINNSGIFLNIKKDDKFLVEIITRKETGLLSKLRPMGELNE